MMHNASMPDSESIQIRFDKSHLVTIGEKLYGESLELLRELISNAYDADAEHVWIDVTSSGISVRDDGWGMDENGLREYLNIGSQNKKNAPLSARFRRHRIGQFGIGKFAVLSACERFRLRTQRCDFAAEIVFDKRDWESSDSWQVPLTLLSCNPNASDGTIVILEQLKRTFTLPDIERYIRERLPLNAPHFSIILNGKRLESVQVSGRRFPVQTTTPYGEIRGELVLPNFPKGDTMGIECLVRSVVVCRSTFGIDLPIVTRLRGRVEADFLPITSDRTRFIVDTPEYRAFVAVLHKEVHVVDRLTREIAKQKEERKADEALKDSLSRMRRAIRRNPDIAPTVLSPTGEIDPSAPEGNAGTMAPSAYPGEEGSVSGYQMLVGAPPSMPTEHTSDAQPKEPAARKIRVRDLRGKSITARRIMVGGIGITCALEHCGKEMPAAFIDGGIVFINLDHPLYKKQKDKGPDLLGFYLTYLLSQQVALLLAEGDARRAFDVQNRLLTDSW